LLAILFDIHGNSLATLPTPPSTVSVALSCACGGSRPIGIRANLQPGSGGRGAWYANVGIPYGRVWNAQLKVNGQTTIGSPTFTIGITHTRGSSPVTIASVADLSGPDALDCRTEELGALYSVELMNIVGGINGRKINQEVLDDGGDPALARSEALQLAAQHPVAFLAPCGQGAGAAIQAIGNSIPTIVADPNVPVTPGRMVFRFAPDPYSEGYAAGQYIAKIGLPVVPTSTPRRVAAFVTSDPESQARLKGLENALEPAGVQVVGYNANGPNLIPDLRNALPETSWLGVYMDGPEKVLSNAVRAVGHNLSPTVIPTAITVSQRLATERFVDESGDLGAEGQIHAITDVDPTSTGAQTYVSLAPQVVGETPTMEGLSGFVAGQALAYGMINGISPQSIESRLYEPGIFSKAAISPWSDRDPSSGTVIFRVFLPLFLTDNLIPLPSSTNGGAPGEVAVGQFWANGDWQGGATRVFTPLPINIPTGPAPRINSYSPHVKNGKSNGVSLKSLAAQATSSVIPQGGSSTTKGTGP
jgi:ABC-type branched-subunit amino acid transport system substrate-binding protein